MLSGYLQQYFMFGSGLLFCRAPTSQKHNHLCCQIWTMWPVHSSTSMTETSTFAASSLGPSTAYLSRWLWPLWSRSALVQARTPAIPWPPCWWPTRDLHAIRSSVLFQLPATTLVIKLCRLPSPSGNIISFASVARHCAMNYCCGFG